MRRVTSEPLPWSRAFLLLRYTLVVATAYLLLAEDHFALPSNGILALLAAALALHDEIVKKLLRQLGGTVP